jgi:ComF family protein
MLNEIFFQECVGCGQRSYSNLPICGDCIKKMDAYDFFCESCGYPAGMTIKICGHCSSQNSRDRIYINYKYKDPIKRLLKEFKFMYRINGKKLFADIIKTELLGVYDIITDVPSHSSRRFRRFSHPAELIAKALSDKTGIPYRRVLCRTKKTEYQFRLKKTQRQKNVKNAFDCFDDVRDLKILLVDDIITTGCTAEECCKVMKISGAAVTDVFALTGGQI